MQVIVRIETRIPRQGSRHIFGKRLRHVRHGRSQCRRVHLPQREGGSGAHPLVGVLEPTGQGGDCAGGFQAAESRAGPIALIDIGGVFRHGDERVHLGAAQPAGAEFGGGIQPDNRIIFAQGGDELLLGITAANRGEFPGPEGVGHRLGAQGLNWIQTFARDIEFFQGHGCVQEIRGGRTAPILIRIVPVGVNHGHAIGRQTVMSLASPPLLATFIHKRAVITALQVPVPALAFCEFRARFLATHIGAQLRPQVGKPLPRMPVGLAPDSRHAHPREILRLRRLVVHATEQDRTHPVLAIAAVIIILPALTRDLVLAPPRLVFAVGNGPTVDIVAEETGRPRNGRLNLRIHDARLLAQHNGELGDQSGRVQRAIGSDRTMTPFTPAAGRRERRKPVAGRAAQSRVFGRVNDILAEPG